MTFLIAASTQDHAALNIANHIIQKYGLRVTERSLDGSPVYRQGNILLAYLTSDSVYSSSLDHLPGVKAIVFASRHRSESGEPTLTVHVPGNLTTQAHHGGNPGEVAWAWPQRMRNALLRLWSLKGKLSIGYRVSLEATHHGPTNLSVPVWFIEIGSGEEHWQDSEAGIAVAEAIWASLTQPPKGKAAVGFGGGHYAPQHTLLCIERNMAVGHILPRYAFEAVERSMIAELFYKTLGGCETAVIDWKGLKSSQRTLLLDELKRIDITEIVKV